MGPSLARLIVLVAMPLGLAGAEFSAGGLTFNVHGYLSQGYMLSDGNNFQAETTDGSFQFNEFALNLSTNLTPRIRTGLQLFSHDLGPISNNEIILDWAYVDYHWRDWLGIRLGKVKIRHGLFFDIRDFDMLRPWAILPQGVHDEVTYDVFKAIEGGSIYGKVNLGAIGAFLYQFNLGDFSAIDSDSGPGLQIRSNVGLHPRSIDANFHYNLYLEWEPPLPGLRLAVSFLTFDVDSKGNFPGSSESVTLRLHNQRLITSSLQWKIGANTLYAEYRTLDHNVQILDTPASFVDADYYYVGLARQITDWLELSGYYAAAFDNRNDRNGADPPHSGWQKDWTLSAKIQPSLNWTFKVEGHYIDGYLMLLGAVNPLITEQRFDEIPRYTKLLVLKATYHF